MTPDGGPGDRGLGRTPRRAMAGGPSVVPGVARDRRDPGGARGVELGGVVARRRGDGVRRPRARLSPLPPARRRGRGGAHGDLARGRRARLPRRHGRRPRLAPARAPAARPARAGARARLARLPRRLRRARGRGHEDRARARTARRGARAAVRRRRPRDARARARGLGTRGVRPRHGGHGASRRGERGRARGGGRDPDLDGVGVLLPRHRMHRRARPRAGRGLVRPDRRLRRSPRQPLHARVLPGGVRRRSPLARLVDRGGSAARGGRR